MRALPLDIGTIHFVGIGGIGMSGIAEIMVNLGYGVQGSDIADNANVQRLREMGIKVAIGHHEDNVEGAQVIVVSSAIKDDNPELAAARARFIPVVRRAEMLGELMRLKWSIAVGGTHGKTTTTSLVSTLLDAAGLDPTVINGGIINAYGTNARLGQGDWMVVEADESDGSFTKLPATIAVVTNIDPEHMEFYRTEETLHQAFETFVENIPFYGFAVLCIDHPVVQSLIGRIEDRRILTYGVSSQADIRLSKLSVEDGQSNFDVVISKRSSDRELRIEGLRIPMLGKHNVLNTLAAIAVAEEMGISEATIRRGLAGFGGVKRRFTLTGEVNTALHAYRRGQWHHRYRRLRAPPGGNFGRPAGRPPGDRRSGHRRRAATPLLPVGRALSGLLLVLQRGRHGDRRRCLYGGRGAHRRRRPRPPGRGASRSRSSQGAGP
jgi:UDP-N-acetylmuramate--alanine ligase